MFKYLNYHEFTTKSMLLKTMSSFDTNIGYVTTILNVNDLMHSTVSANTFLFLL